ncbi:hypothetical protein JAAARDRAFT_303656 [Jaapia argillacea MUCL 33604]|uniref:cAMP-dependent protein kinase n=1 Tax=Jaapia argillacea MUCL 33604 TaxID=933084 RepID=A0A067Q024_9AGAM|nr:hypothetical protein JAAARDRAFT_303656 [Jaapia argillacea MUCL 33604]
MGILHRDIKPENLLVDRFDHLRITDFGTAYVHDGPLDHWRTYCAELAGTVGYTAPEAWKARPYGCPIDWWALGCTLFDMITGDILFESQEELAEYMDWNRLVEGISYMQFVAPDLTVEEESLISGLLRVSPSTRFSILDLRKHPYFYDSSG